VLHFKFRSLFNVVVIVLVVVDVVVVVFVIVKGGTRRSEVARAWHRVDTQLMKPLLNSTRFVLHF
jgi:hypothetical protein